MMTGLIPPLLVLPFCSFCYVRLWCYSFRLEKQGSILQGDSQPTNVFILDFLELQKLMKKKICCCCLIF